MSAVQAVERLQGMLSHLWMIRQFLKHADEVQEDEEMLDVHRLLYDSIRAVEPAFQRGDHEKYLRRLKGKLGKLRRGAEFFSTEYKRVSTHTNFEMAAASFTAALDEMERVFAEVDSRNASVD